MCAQSCNNPGWDGASSMMIQWLTSCLLQAKSDYVFVDTTSCLQIACELYETLPSLLLRSSHPDGRLTIVLAQSFPAARLDNPIDLSSLARVLISVSSPPRFLQRRRSSVSDTVLTADMKLIEAIASSLDTIFGYAKPVQHNLKVLITHHYPAMSTSPFRRSS
jgi:hypothetical protein